MAEPAPVQDVILDGSEAHADFEMAEVAKPENLDDIAGDTASEDEDEEVLQAEPAISGEDEDDDAEEEDVDAEDVLEELTFTAQKKLADVVKCVHPLLSTFHGA